MKLRVTVDGKAYEVDVELVEEEEVAEPHAPLPPPPPPHPPVVTQTYPVAATADTKVCLSPVTGLVNKVNAEAGQSVAEGDLLIVLESMKMESNVVAPAAATVKAVHVQPGDSVKMNQPLVEFE